MTLHEAIELVLQKAQIPMSASEIAEVINFEKLYSRKDNLPVSATQINARVNNYNNLFTKEAGKIKLVKNDISSIKFEYYRNDIVHNLNKNDIWTFNFNKLKHLKNSLEKVFNNSDDFSQDKNLVQEPQSKYTLSRYEIKSKLDTAYRLCNWYLLQDPHDNGIFNDDFTSLLAGLNWFNKNHNNIITDIFGFNYFLLKIIEQNIEATFQIKEESTHKPLIFNKETVELNQLIAKFCNDCFSTKQIKSKLSNIGIFIPPIGKRYHSLIPIEFEGILSEIHLKNDKLDKAILIVPFGALTSIRSSMIEARHKLIESNYLETVVDFPSGMLEKTGLKISMLLFDFNRISNENILFIDATQIAKEGLSKTLEIINSRKTIDNISKLVESKLVIYNKFNLNPKVYVSNVSDFPIEKGKTIYTLSQIIIEHKVGNRYDPSIQNLFYTGGEYKMIRISDLDTNSIYFKPNENIIGLDHDQLLNKDQILVKGGLVLSSYNNKIKANTLPEEEKYLIGNSIYWIKPNESIVLGEYLTKEFSKPYINQQIEFYSKGSIIPKLYLKDLLKLQIQIPSIETQKEELLKEFRTVEKVSDDKNVISELELDFIKTLKHTLKQPAAGLSNDFATLKKFLLKKIEKKQTIENDEITVPVFEGDIKEELINYSLENTLSRMERSLIDIDYILEQAITLISITSLNKKDIELKSFLDIVKSDYPDVHIIVSGSKVNIFVDTKQLRILFKNLIDNAEKHGFKSISIKPTIWIEIIKKDELSIQISVRNNGKPLPPEFTIEDFLAKGNSSKTDVGSGFGGFLIGQIIKNHKGKIVLNNNKGNEILPHNVEFIITLPR